MPHLPDPKQYSDPIRYFRDSHALIATQINLLERLVARAEANGVVSSIKADKEWAELLDFLVNVAPRHEADEEQALFPVVLAKVPHVGFQNVASPSRFIHEQHEVMQLHAIEVLRVWKQTLAAQEISVDEATKFLSAAKELVLLYRDHVRRENEIIYTVANDELLSPQERVEIMKNVLENHSDEVISDTLDFDTPTYSVSEYAPAYMSGSGEDAVSDESVELDESEEVE